MSRFLVTIVAGGNCYRREEIAKTDVDAIEKAKARLPFSFDCRVCGVKWLGRCA